jgi:hypothetical protein
MKFWEAMKAMEEGKKIKRPGVYSFDKAALLKSEFALSCRDMAARDWKVVEEEIKPDAIVNKAIGYIARILMSVRGDDCCVSYFIRLKEIEDIIGVDFSNNEWKEIIDVLSFFNCEIITSMGSYKDTDTITFYFNENNKAEE